MRALVIALTYTGLVTLLVIGLLFGPHAAVIVAAAVGATAGIALADA